MQRRGMSQSQKCENPAEVLGLREWEEERRVSQSEGQGREHLPREGAQGTGVHRTLPHGPSKC